MKNNQPLDPYLKLHSKANDKTIPNNWKRGIVNAVYVSSASADIQIVGNTTTIIKGVYLSSAINPKSIRPGDKVLLWMFSEINPNDCIVLCAYGRSFNVSASTSGFVTVPANSTAYAVPHKLGAVPTIQSVSSYVAEVDSGNVFVSTSQAADATNIYLENDSSSVNIGAYWAASTA